MSDTKQGDRYDWAEDPTAQDVIDALRVVLMAQEEPTEAIKIVRCVLEFAPETLSSRGIELLMRLISETTLKVALVDATDSVHSMPLPLPSSGDSESSDLQGNSAGDSR